MASHLHYFTLTVKEDSLQMLNQSQSNFLKQLSYYISCQDHYELYNR